MEPNITAIKKLRIVCLVLECVATTALFLPWCYVEKYYLDGRNTHSYDQNFFGGLTQGDGVISIIVLLLMITSIVLLVVGIIRSKNVTMGEVIVSLLTLLLMAISAFIRLIRVETFVDDGIFAYWRFDFNWLLYLIIAMQIAVTAITTIAKFIVSKLKRQEI